MSLPGLFSAPEPIAGGHQTAGFGCGEEALDIYLWKFALANHQAGYARTFVSCDADRRVLGYYSLAAGQILRAEASERLSRGAALHPIPIVVLARLAVDRNAQGHRLGQSLLLDAIRRVLSAAEPVGIRAILVHAKHEQAADYYRKYAGFESLPGNPLVLSLLLKDARRALSK